MKNRLKYIFSCSKEGNQIIVINEHKNKRVDNIRFPLSYLKFQRSLKNNMSNIEYFKKQVPLWAKKFGLGNITVRSCSTMWFSACVAFEGNKKFMYYNPVNIKGLCKFRLLHLIFHELGHFKHPVWNDDHFNTHLEKMTAEYMAEKQSLVWLKKYKPRFYTKAVKRIPLKIKNMLRYPAYLGYYFEAFSQIPEYEEVMNNG